MSKLDLCATESWQEAKLFEEGVHIAIPILFQEISCFRLQHIGLLQDSIWRLAYMRL